MTATSCKNVFVVNTSGQKATLRISCSKALANAWISSPFCNIVVTIKMNQPLIFFTNVLPQSHRLLALILCYFSLTLKATWMQVALFLVRQSYNLLIAAVTRLRATYQIRESHWSKARQEETLSAALRLRGVTASDIHQMLINIPFQGCISFEFCRYKQEHSEQPYHTARLLLTLLSSTDASCVIMSPDRRATQKRFENLRNGMTTETAYHCKWNIFITNSQQI